jgi:hypothetical protein
MTNIHTRLKNLDFLLRGVNNEGKEDDEVSSEHATHHTPHHKWVKNPNHSGYLLDDDIGSKEDIKRRDDEIEEKLRKRKKKAVMTNVHSRLKSLDFLLRGQCHMEHEGSCAEAQATESSEETKRKHGKKQKKEAKKGEAQLKSIQSRIGISDFLLRAAPIGTGADEPGNKPSQRKLDEQKELDDSGYSMSVHDWIKGQHTRQGQADEANYGWDEGKWEGLDELTSGGKKTGKKDIIESYPDKKGTKQSTKKSYFERVKDGEFGGMNTGETEWTEPRDTANSRTKRDKDVA